MRSSLRLLVPAILPVLFGLLGCSQQEPSRYDEVDKNTRGTQQPAVTKDAVDGKVFNAFFPKAEGDHKIVFKQEKTGFAQASLQSGGKELATLSISDTSNNPDARTKFADATTSVGGFPSAAAGSKGLSVLVGDRFQVQIRSVDPAFGEADRDAWMQKFDLPGIAQIGT